MKKIIVLLGLIFLITNVQGQNLRFGISAQPTGTFFKVEPEKDSIITKIENKGLRVGFLYGLLAEFSIAENYAVELNINHVLSGGKFRADYESGKTLNRTKWNLQFVEVPVTIKMRTREFGYLSFYGKFGFAPSFQIKSRGFPNIKFQTQNPDSKEDFEIEANFFSSSLIIGLGTEYSLGGSTALFGGFTFHNGFTQIDRSRDYKVKDAFVAMELGVLF